MRWIRGVPMSDQRRPLAPGWERVHGWQGAVLCDGTVAYDWRSPGPLCPNSARHTAAYQHLNRCQWVCEEFAVKAGVFADSVPVAAPPAERTVGVSMSIPTQLGDAAAALGAVRSDGTPVPPTWPQVLHDIGALRDECERLSKLYADALDERDEARRESRRACIALADEFVPAKEGAGAHVYGSPKLASYVRRLEDRLSVVRSLLEQAGCTCRCRHQPGEHNDECVLCLACLVGAEVDLSEF